MSTTDIEIFPKTELQEDWYTQSTIGVSSIGSYAVNLDRNGRLTISFIKDGRVFNAYRNLDRNGNAVRAWTIDETNFPSSTEAIFLDSILAPSDTTFLAAIGADNTMYFLDSSSRFPHWEPCPLYSGYPAPSLLKLFITREDKLKILVDISDSSYHGMFIYDPFRKTWDQEVTISSSTSANSITYKVGFALTQTSDHDKSQWGYLIDAEFQHQEWSGRKCTIVSEGRSLAILNSAIKKKIDNYEGGYVSIACVAIGGNMPKTTPLVFGVRKDTSLATYLQAQGDGTYSAVFPFGKDHRFTYLDAVFRTGPDVNQNNVEWIDLFGLDTSGNLWHTRNAAYDSSRYIAVKRLSNGDIVVPEWEAPSIISSKIISSFRLATEMNGAGNVYVVTKLDSSSSSALEVYIQDMASTSWTKTAVASIDHAAPDVLKRKVYYVELTVRKGGVTAPGLMTQITSPEFCQIDVNGVSTSVASGQFYNARTNEGGLIYLTIPANESLACPALSVWVQGMDADKIIDIAPTGNILKRLANIKTKKDLKNAKDQKDQTEIFGGLTDSQLETLAKNIHEAATAFNLNGTSSGSTGSKAYLHPQASREVAFTRHVSNRHMGLISHLNPGRSFHICVRQDLLIAHLPEPMKRFVRADGSIPLKQRNILDNITSSWGDFWTQVSNGVVEVASIAWDTISDGVKAAVTCVIDGVVNVWNGVAHGVNQVFDVFADLFRDAKVTSEKIFNWLAYIFAWDDIKSTAVALRDSFNEQINMVQDYMDNTAREQLRDFIENAKSWLKDNDDNITTATENLTIGEYDKPESDDSDPRNQLPSSASWLSNKVESASKSADFNPLNTMTDGFNSTFQSFMNKVTDTGISDDLSTALQNAKDFFMSLTSRGLLDSVTLKSLFQVFKSIGVCLLDLLEAVVDTLVDVLVQTLKMLKDLVDTPIDIPLISKIFKNVVGLDLTLFNLITVPLAVPVTVLYKIFAGEAPFPLSKVTSSTARIKKDDVRAEATKEVDAVMLLSSLLTVFTGGAEFIMDSAGPTGNGNPRLRIPKYLNLFGSWGLLGLAALEHPFNARTIFGLEVIIWGTAASSLVVISDTGSRKIACLDPIKPIVEFLEVVVPVTYGVFSLASGIWHIVNISLGTETNTGKDKAIVVAEITGSLPGVAKVLNLTKDPLSKEILLFIDCAGYMVSAFSYFFAAITVD